MKGNRDMFYQNYQAGGFGNAPMPSGYNYNSQYQAYGPNAFYNEENYLEERLSRIEKSIRNLDQRLDKIESVKDTTDSYMI